MEQKKPKMAIAFEFYDDGSFMFKKMGVETEVEMLGLIKIAETTLIGSILRNAIPNQESPEKPPLEKVE